MSTSFLPQAVILCSGDYPTHAVPLHLLQEAERIVCCDSAAFSLMRHGLQPWRIVGDCDSILAPKTDEERQMLEACRPLLLCIPEQLSNDLTKSIHFCHQQGLRRIAIVGATGKREDHTLGNISLLIEYMRLGMEVRMYTDYGYFIPCQGATSFDVPIPEDFSLVPDTDPHRTKSTQVSIFNFTAKQFTSTGLRYPFDHLGNWWMGTLNEAIASPFTLKADGEYIVYINYEN